MLLFCRSLKRTKFQLLDPETLTHKTFEHGYVSTFERKYRIYYSAIQIHIQVVQ